MGNYIYNISILQLVFHTIFLVPILTAKSFMNDETFTGKTWQPYCNNQPKAQQDLNDRYKFIEGNIFSSDKKFLVPNQEGDFLLKEQKAADKIKWEKVNGPFGGDARKFYIFENTLYVNTNREIYRNIKDKWASLNFEEIMCSIIYCMYRYSSGKLIVGTDYGLFYSDNEGENWYRVFIPSDLQVRDMLPLEDENIFLSTSKGIYLLEKNLNHHKWGLDGINVVTLSLDNTGNIWAGTNHGVYKANYYEQNWKKLELPDDYYKKIIFDINGVGYTFSSYCVIRTKDYGETWDYLCGPYTTDIRLGFQNQLIITTWNKIYYADDFGIIEESKPFNNFLLNTFILDENLFLVGCLGAGVYKYYPEEDEFELFNNGLNSATVNSIVSMKNGKLLVSTTANKSYISDDHGNTWRTVYDAALSIKNIQENTLFASARSKSGMVKSDDYGETWKELNINVEPYFISAFDVSGDSKTICAGSSTGELWISDDGGKTFIKRKKTNYIFVDAVKVLDQNRFIICNDSLYFTDDRGVTLKSVKEDILGVKNIINDKKGYLYIASYRGLYKSLTGKSWRRLPAQYGYFLKTDEDDDLYSISREGAIQFSTDCGNNWNAVTTESYTTFIWSFEIDPSLGFLFGSQDKGLYMLKVDIEKNKEKTFRLINNFPNPFNSSTRIEYEIPQAEFIKLVVFDILGREIETLISGYKSAGFHFYQWNTKNYSSGIYICKLEAGSLSAVQKMVLIK